MSFQVVRHEHPDIFVLNRQTYETYRFTVGDNVGLPIDGVLSDLSEARRSREPLINLRIMAYCAFDSRATVWTGS